MKREPILNTSILNALEGEAGGGARARVGTRGTGYGDPGGGLNVLQLVTKAGFTSGS